MHNKRSGFAAAAPSDGKIYVFGGQFPAEGKEKGLDSVEKYDPILNKWTNEKPMPTGRNGSTAVPFNDMIFNLGGQYFDDSGRHPTDLNEIFHIGKHESNEVL